VDLGPVPQGVDQPHSPYDVVVHSVDGPLLVHHREGGRPLLGEVNHHVRPEPPYGLPEDPGLRYVSYLEGLQVAQLPQVGLPLLGLGQGKRRPLAGQGGIIARAQVVYAVDRVPPPQHPQGQGPAQVAVDSKYHYSLGLQLAQPSLKSPGDKKRWWTPRVYPWRSFSLLLITSSSATGTPLKGSYTVTLRLSHCLDAFLS